MMTICLWTATLPFHISCFVLSRRRNHIIQGNLVAHQLLHEVPQKTDRLQWATTVWNITWMARTEFYLVTPLQREWILLSETGLMMTEFIVPHWILIHYNGFFARTTTVWPSQIGVQARPYDSEWICYQQSSWFNLWQRCVWHRR